MRRDITTIIVGFLFLAAGVAVGGSMLGFFNFTISFDGWWTLFLIVPALLAIIQGGFNLGNVVLLSVGVVLLLDAQNVLPRNFSWRLVLPLILLVVGFQLVFGNRGNRDNRHYRSGKADTTHTESAHTDHNHSGAGYKSASAIFGGQDILYGPEDFTGGNYTAMFGGLTVNLQSVTLVGDVIIHVTAMFGGIDLILPDNVQVISNVLPILGGVDCKYASSRDPLAPKVIINGNVSFGGIDIK